MESALVLSKTAQPRLVDPPGENLCSEDDTRPRTRLSLIVCRVRKVKFGVARISACVWIGLGLGSTKGRQESIERIDLGRNLLSFACCCRRYRGERGRRGEVKELTGDETGCMRLAGACDSAVNAYLSSAKGSREEGTPRTQSRQSQPPHLVRTEIRRVEVDAIFCLRGRFASQIHRHAPAGHRPFASGRSYPTPFQQFHASRHRCQLG